MYSRALLHSQKLSVLRIGGTSDGVTGVLDLQFVVDLCQLLFGCIKTPADEHGHQEDFPLS